ncbi:MAG: hypothetical protein IPI58_06765 [Alphaproteobacteria bacterium]|nr:MAG: hypothetical protein IPI58_06765 [Alphaproteobacteria bacterium]
MITSNRVRGIVALSLSIPLVVAGCRTEEIQKTIDERAAVAAEGVDRARQPAPALRHRPLEVIDAVWAGNQSVYMQHGQPLPSRWEGSRSVALVSAAPMELPEIIGQISAQTGIPLRMIDGAGETASKGSEAGDSSGVRLAYEGSLSGLLNYVSSRFGVSWRYDGSAITLSKFETRVFVMEAMPGKQTFEDGIQDETTTTSSTSTVTSSLGGTNTLKQNSKMKADLDFWQDVGETLNTVMGGVGSYRVSPTTGTVTVVTTPDLMRIVARYLEEENKRLSRQVAINVEIYSVELGSDEDFNANFSTALKRLSGFGANFVGPSAAAITGASSLNVAILNPDTVGQVGGIFKMLSTMGNVARVAQFPMTTLNNRTVSRRIGRDISYLQSSQSTISGDLQTTTLTPGAVRDGFSLQLTPRLLPDGRIMMQYSLSLIDLIKISSFSSSDSSIQLPETSNRIFVQQSKLRSGSTLLLAGYDQDTSTMVNQGVGDPNNIFLGGDQRNQKSRSVMFIAMTPQELRDPREESD